MTDAPSARPGQRAGVGHALLVLEGLILLATAPGAVGLVLLGRAPAVALVALMLVPAGPALAAALFVWRRLEGGSTDGVVPLFRRGYRVSGLDGLRVWLPVAAVLAAFGTLLERLDSEALRAPAAVGVACVVLGAIVWAWGAHLLAVAAVFSFRLFDTVRVAAFMVLGRPRATLAVLVLGVAVVAAGWAAGPWVLVPTASVVSLLLWYAERGLLAEVQRRFVDAEPHPDGEDV